MSTSPAHSFPAAHALQLVALVRRFGVRVEDLLGESGLTERELEEPHARISAETLRDLSERARTLTAEPGIGFYLGLQKRLSMYGYLGFAAMSAATVRESLELAVRFAPAVSTGLSLDLQVEGDVATVLFEEHVDMGSAHDIAVFSLLVGMGQISAALTGRGRRRVTVDIPFARPDYFPRFAHLLPDARFGQQRLRLRFPARGLEFPLVSPDRAALRLAREACERQLQDLGFDRTLPERVRRLVREAESFPSIEAVARSVRLSSRTLKRKLAAAGVAFSEVIENERRERAFRLLRANDLSLDEIARRLDYSTQSAFARAFRRWTGEPPSRFRGRAGQ
jgi:AraC-like DNA-binding protein